MTLTTRFRRRLRLPLWLLAVLLLGGCAAPSTLLFYPMKPLRHTPAALGLAYEDVFLTAADGTALHGWYLPPVGAARGNLLVLHGNAENISTHFVSVAWLPAAGYGVLALDYRGFGRSAGVPGLPQVFADVAAASDWLFSHTAPPHFLLGQSLGAALAVGFLADPRSRRFSALLLDAPFARYRDIGRYALSRGWFGRIFLAPAANLLPQENDPLDRIGRATQPLLFYASPNDPIVPLAQTRQLYAAAPAPKQLSLHQGGHIATFADPAQRQLTLQFLHGAASAAGRSTPPR